MSTGSYIYEYCSNSFNSFFYSGSLLPDNGYQWWPTLPFIEWPVISQYTMMKDISAVSTWLEVCKYMVLSLYVFKKGVNLLPWPEWDPSQIVIRNTYTRSELRVFHCTCKIHVTVTNSVKSLWTHVIEQRV